MISSSNATPHIHRNKLRLEHRHGVISYFYGPPFLPSCSSFTAFLLLHVQDSVAAGARVVGVLELFHEEGDQAAAQD